MASRHLRRLQKQDFQDVVAESETDESSEEESAAVSTSVSAFALLRTSDGEESEEEEEELEEEDRREREEREREEQRKALEQQAAAKAKKNNKKKKNKRNKKNKKSEAKGQNAEETGEEEDIDKLLEEFGVNASASTQSQQQASGADGGASAKSEINDLLVIERDLISPDRELRRMFGSGAFNANRERKGRQHRLRRMKKSILFEAPDNWPKPDIGLSMEHLDTKAGSNYFEYKWSEHYRDLQEKFETIVENSYDPNSLVEFLRHNFYHLDTLLNLFYVYTHMGDYTTADMLLQRCIYALESAFHPWFDITAGNCRLSYGVEANQIIFKVLFLYIKALSRRGCHRSALEVCKLLLSFDFSDPMGVLFCIDYHSLRAREYVFLLELVSKYEKAGGKLSFYPNFAFAVALAKYFLEKDGLALDDSNRFAAETSEKILGQAILTFPSALTELLSKLTSKSMIQMTVWSKYVELPFFENASDTDSASLNHLIDLFVNKSYELWKDTGIQSWMLKTTKDLFESDNIEGASADRKVLRSEIFPPSEDNEYKHIKLSDFSDQMNQIPEDVLLQLRGQQQQPAPALGQVGQTTHIGGEQLRGSNPLTMLLQSLMPWVSVDSSDDNNENNNNAEM